MDRTCFRIITCSNNKSKLILKLIINCSQIYFYNNNNMGRIIIPTKVIIKDKINKEIIKAQTKIKFIICFKTNKDRIYFKLAFKIKIKILKTNKIKEIYSKVKYKVKG